MAETGFVYQRSEGIQILKEEAETLLDYLFNDLVLQGESPG